MNCFSVHFFSIAPSSGETLSPPFGDRQNGEQTAGTDNRGNDETVTAAGQRNQSNGLGGSHELTESGSGRSDIQGTDIHLNDSRDTNIDDKEINSDNDNEQPSDDIIIVPLFPTEKEQREEISEREQTEKTVLSEITKNDIDNALIYWNGNEESKNKVYNYMKENGRSRAMHTNF